jgi:hypothetical protein
MRQRVPKTGCRTCSCADPGWLGRLDTFPAAAGAAARCERIVDLILDDIPRDPNALNYQPGNTRL